ncbi:hypothetical protein N9204_00260 [bacterium]|nr:hypothetical protein [bacterium]
MEIYDFDEIKAAGSCIDFMLTELGQQPRGKTGEYEKFNCPWIAGSDGYSFHVSAKGYKYHAGGDSEDSSGSIIDLCAHALFSGDMFEAAAHLGKKLGLRPKSTARESARIVKTYDYIDLSGVLRHQTVRYEPKDFRQRRPDPDKPGKHKWSLIGIEPILYRMQDWKDAETVCIVGGEKDADNLLAIGVPATTNAMGEGNWKAHYNDHLKGRHVVIIPDNDNAGKQHADSVAAHLFGKAETVKIIHLPDLPAKGDVSDWLSAGATKERLANIIKVAEPLTEVPTDALNDEDLKAKVEAKRANMKAFANFRMVVRANAEGVEKLIAEPRALNEMIDDIKLRFLGFPRRVGTMLFDHDRKTGEINLLREPSDLMAWISSKSGKNHLWKHRLEGAVTQRELFSILLKLADHYEMISSAPNWPLREDVYYTNPRLPEPSPDHEFFRKLLGYFNAYTEADKLKLSAFFATPLYFRSKVDRPLWIIDSEDGQGAGKTKLVEMLAYLYGGEGDPDSCEPIWISFKEVNNENNSERVVRRILSPSGRRKRIVLLDNVEGYYKSPTLATMATQGSISGMAPYGKGEETRTNDLTYIITSNSATVSKDIASRAFFIVLKKPERPLPYWQREVVQYIEQNRYQILSDINDLLSKGAQFDFEPATRFKDWERDVLAPCCITETQYEDVFKHNASAQDSADGEQEEAELILDHMEQNLMKVGVGPEVGYAWIQTPVLKKWVQDALPGFGGHNGQGTVQKMRNMCKVGHFGVKLTHNPEIWPQSSTAKNRKRGMFWNNLKYTSDIEAMPSDVKIIKLNSEGVVEVTV